MSRGHGENLIVVGALALALSACGGGDGMAFIPAPPPVPTPTPTPAPTASEAFGVTSDTQFPAVGDGFQIRWNNQAQSYEISFPASGSTAAQWDRLVRIADGNYYPSSGSFGVNLHAELPYQYTKLATVFENGWGTTVGQFAFGVPTTAGEIPASGSASYDARVWGTGRTPDLQQGQYYDVLGTAKLNFDFAAGTLAGSMQNSVVGPYGSFSTPVYEFSQTAYSKSGGTFSGSFAVPNSSASSHFQGQFTGPNAAELMAQWSAPFFDTARTGGAVQGTMSGVWIGLKSH